MKKLSFLIPMAAVVFLATSCIENEESDSVKSMRQAQTALINAQATAQTTLANSQAAVNTAQAALLQAQANAKTAEIALTAAQVKAQELENSAKEEENRHKVEMNKLREELAAARTAQQKATITQQMAEAESAHANEMARLESEAELVVINAERAKANAQTSLLAAQEQLDLAQMKHQENMEQANLDHTRKMEELRVQALADKDEALQKLIDQYDAAYYQWSSQNSQISTINSNILAAQYQMTVANANFQGYVAMLKEDVDNATESVADATADLERAKLPVDQQKAQYEAEKAELTTEIAALKTTYDAAAAEKEKRYVAMQKASAAFNAAGDKVYGSYYNQVSGGYTYTGTQYLLDIAYNVNLENALQDSTMYANMLKNQPAQNAYYYQRSLNNSYSSPSFQIVNRYTYWFTTSDAEGTQTKLDKATAQCAAARTAYNAAKKANNAALLEYTTAEKAYNDAVKAYDAAYNEYRVAQGNLSAKSSRLISVENSLANIEVNGVNGTYLPNLEDNLKWAKENLADLTNLYNAAKDAYGKGLDFNDYNGAQSMGAYIADLQQELAAAKTKLDLYKVELDKWAAELESALAAN